MRKQPHAVTAAIQALTKLGVDHGLETVHQVYGETVAELMGQREREAWRKRVSEAQDEMFALLGTGY